MALTGLDIYKQLPKKNCGECGPPTCLAFAMSLAAGKAELTACPYVSEEAKENLAAAAAPPIRKVTVGIGDAEVVLGDEQVIFRHEKTFYHPTGIAVLVSDTLSADEIDQRVKKINDLVIERVGQVYMVEMIAVANDSGSADTFAQAVERVAGATGKALVLIASDPAAMESAVSKVAERRPLVYAADSSNYEAMTELAKANNCPLAVKGKDLSDLADVSEKVLGLGYKELVLDPGSRGLSQSVADLTQIRRLAVKKKFRPFGFPTIAFATGDDTDEEAVNAGILVAKYAGVVVTSAIENHQLMPVLTVRQNIYTDPQKPIQVEAKVSPVGEVGRNSPVYVTTNFSLTYFSVEGEVEASKVPSYILPVDTDGTSVLTAWADGKFSGEIVAKFIKECGIEDMVDHREVIIPGHVAVISGKLEEASGWKVIVGPREAAGISAFIKSRVAS